MSNLLEILEAWQKSFNPNENDLNIAKERSEICNICEFKIELNNSLLKKFTSHDQILNKYKCSKCGCILSKKLFSIRKESCPLKKWLK